MPVAVDVIGSSFCHIIIVTYHISMYVSPNRAMLIYSLPDFAFKLRIPLVSLVSLNVCEDRFYVFTSEDCAALQPYDYRRRHNRYEK